MTIEQRDQSPTEVQVTLRGEEITMSLQRQGVGWTLNGGGLSGTARTPGEVFVTTLGIVDGKKARRKWEEDGSMEGGVENGRKVG